MKILYITWGFPYPPLSGAPKHDFHLIKHLSKSHQIFLFSLIEFPDQIRFVPEMKSYCNQVEYFQIYPRPLVKNILGLLKFFLSGRPLVTYNFFYEEMAARLCKIIEKWKPDIVQIEHSLLSSYVEVIPSNVKKVLSFHNFGERQYYRIFRVVREWKQKAVFLLKWLAMRGWEAKYAGKFDACLTVSAEEGQMLKDINPRLNISVIENGVDTEKTPFLADPSGENILLFVGTMSYPPNGDAIQYFCRLILPLIEEEIPDIQVIVIGHMPPPDILKLAEKPNVKILGFVEDLVPYYRQARAVIVPLRAGAGTRLKILEAMAFGRPVVSTRLGAEGLNVRDGEDILIADTPELFAGKTVQLLRDSLLERKILNNARRLVKRQYDWNVIGRKLSELYKNFEGEKRPSCEANKLDPAIASERIF